MTIRRTTATLAVLWAAVACGCSNDGGTSENRGSDNATASHEHQHSGGEHEHGGDEHDEGEHEHGGGEHGRESGEHAREGRGEHDRDGDGHHGEEGAEGEESGTEFGLNERYDETRHGARLVLAYDAESNSFHGTVENTTKETLERVRVEVHLSNGRELGPTTPADLQPGEKREIKLAATSTNFDGFSAHPEVGNREHTTR